MNTKEKAKSGQMICGTMIRTMRNPSIICLAKNAGLDFVMFDCACEEIAAKEEDRKHLLLYNRVP